MLWIIGGILMLLWLLCFVGHGGGGLFPLSLAMATVVFLVYLLMRDPENSWA